MLSFHVQLEPDLSVVYLNFYVVKLMSGNNLIENVQTLLNNHPFINWWHFSACFSLI